MFNSTLITVFIGQYKSEGSDFTVVPTQNAAPEVWNYNPEESVKKKRMNECLVNNIIPDLLLIQLLNLLVMSFELVIPISNKNKIKILKNNNKRIYLTNNVND
jgi:hypothetical protein